MDEQTLNLLRRVSRYVFIGIAILLVLLLLLALLRVSIGFWLWSTVETWATVRLGLDSDAAQLATVVLVSLITLLLPTLAWYFLWGKATLRDGRSCWRTNFNFLARFNDWFWSLF